jgi:two-component system, NtrC family, sensor histidine kinase HydH
MKVLKANPKPIEGIKPFRLVKYLSLTSLMVILVCTLLLSGFISQRARTMVFHKSEQYALLVAENLNHQVFYQFTLPTLLSEGEIRLSRKNQYERLDRVVRNTIHGFSVESVNIYDPDQFLTYSTDPEKVGTKGEIGDAFKDALAEQSVSLLSHEEHSFLGIEWKGGTRTLKTYLPMWEERSLSWKRGKVLGVFEITQDMTRDYASIRRFQWIVAMSFLGFVGVLFTTILLIARRAERIITGRAAEQRKLEEKLHQAERLAALGEMIAGISHEIRNPLGIIRSTAELLHGRTENERQKRFSSIIVEEATRLNDILTEFLDFARPKTLRPLKCQIEDVLERNLKAMEPEFQKLGVQVERDYESGGFTLEADPDLLYRAFVNLFANALQAMPEGGRLRIRTSLANGKLKPAQMELVIQDTGPGISPKIRKKIFNPFFTTREKGTGLGLAIVRNIIDSHNGEIEVESEEGKGTTMIIRLPLFQLQSEEDIEPA